MSTFDESKHDRDLTGKFTEMAGSEQDDALAAPAAVDTGAATPEFLAVYSGPAEHAAEAYALAVWTVIAEPDDAALGAAIREHGAQGALVTLLGDGMKPAEIAEHLDMDVEKVRMLRMRSNNWTGRSQEAFRRAAQAGIHIRTGAEGGPPGQFADLGDHAPLALWVRGSDEALDAMADGVSIVGARAATSYGERAAMELANDAAYTGRTVVTSANYGIDGVATRAALSAGGQPVVFTATGVDVPYPAGHADLINRVVSAGGAVVSELPPGEHATKWRFAARNRLVGAATGVTIVVEAGPRSGSLRVASQAGEMARRVGAVPGPITSAASAGANALIRDREATLISSSDDMLALIESARTGRR